MTTYNTGNPIGSTDARDLYDNAQNFDTAVNTSNPVWVDRFGVARQSLASAAGFVIDTPWLNAEDFTTLAEADAAAAAANKQLAISTVWAVAAATTLTSAIKVLPGGGFSGSGALNIDGPFESGLYQVFTGTNAVTFGANSCRVVYPEWWGATDGAVSTSAVQAAIATSADVDISYGKTFLVKNLSIVTTSQKIQINGTLKLPNGCADGDTIFTATGVDSIKLVGKGVLDGNKAGQSGAVSQRLINFLSCNNVFIGGGITFKDNYGGAGVELGAIYITGNYNIIDNVRLEDWSIEGIWLDENSYSSVSNVTAIDNDGDSWSAVQVGGTTSIHNRISNITTYNTGASAVGMDSQYSSIENIVVDTVRFQNGVNLGHSTKPASYSTVSNIVVKNLTDNVNTNSAGLSIVNGTTGVVASNILIDGSTRKGINISANAANIALKNVRLKSCNVGINIYQAGAVEVDGLVIEATTATGITKDTGASSNFTTLNLSNADLTGATSKLSGASGGLVSTYVDYVRVYHDIAVTRSGAQDIAALGAGGTVTVTNANALSHSKIILEPSNIAGASALPFISTQNDGSFVITTVNNGAAGAYVRWKII